MVGEARQGEEQTQLAVVVLGRAVLLQTVETLDCLLHGELQLTLTENAERIMWLLKVQHYANFQVHTFILSAY